MLLQGQGVRQSVGWLGRFVRCFEARSPGHVEESGGSETKCVSSSASSLSVGKSYTASQGCYLPVRPSSCPDFKNPDGHWKVGECCEEPKRPGVAVARSTHESAGPSVGASGQTRYDSMDLQDGPGHGGTRIHQVRTMSNMLGSHRHRHSLGSLGVDISHHRSGTGRRVQSRICRPSLQRCSSTSATSPRSTVLSRRRSCWRFKP